MPFGQFQSFGPYELNAIPSGLTILTPLLGEEIVIGNPVDITWTAATDLDDDDTTLRYHVQIKTLDDPDFVDAPGLPETGGGVGLTAANQLAFSILTTIDDVGGLWRLRIRAYDGLDFGPFVETSFLIIPPPKGDAALTWLDPDTDEIWAQESWRWYNPEYDPWSTLQHTFEEFGTLTKIRQPVEVNPRFAVLSGSGSGVDDDIVKRILGRRAGFDTTRPWHKAKVLFKDLFNMEWEVKITRFVPIFSRGHELADWRFEFAVVAHPSKVETPSEVI